MRLSFPYVTLLVTLALACGDKGDTSDSTDATGAQTTDQTTDQTSGASSGASTGPTTTASPSTTQTTDECSGFDSCGIQVEMSGAVCEQPGGLQATTDGPEPPSLSAMYLDTDRVVVKETGYETSCCLTLTPELAIDQQTITVTYTESGDPCDCSCNYTIDYTLRKVPAGDWTIKSGALSADVTVP